MELDCSAVAQLRGDVMLSSTLSARPHGPWDMIEYAATPGGRARMAEESSRHDLCRPGRRPAYLTRYPHMAQVWGAAVGG